MTLAAAALQLGHCCIIDRCNLDVKQREDFIHCAQELRVEVSLLCSPQHGSARQQRQRRRQAAAALGPHMSHPYVHKKLPVLRRCTRSCSCWTATCAQRAPAGVSSMKASCRATRPARQASGAASGCAPPACPASMRV